MVALKARDIESFLARPDPAIAIFLLYGPDSGLVHERADALIKAAVDDINDPFALVRMDGDELASEPSRLLDEAMTVPLFGGRRAIRVRAGNKNLAASIALLLDAPIKDCRIVIEGGDMRRDNPLLATCQKAKIAAAIPCYADTERDLARLIDTEMRAADLRIAPDARQTLTALLGGDRQASRQELRKLALYAHGAREVTLDDVQSIVTDASALAVDAIADHAFAGRIKDVETGFAKAMAAEIYPGAIISSALRLATQLHKARLDMDNGADAEQAKRSRFPNLHFSRTNAIDAALNQWRSERLGKLIVQIGDSAFEARRTSALAPVIAQRLMMSIALNARARA